MRRRAASALTLSLLVGGCVADPPDEAPTELQLVEGQSSQKADEYFQGTPAEFTVQLVGCLKDDGWDVWLTEDGLGYDTDLGGRSVEELQSAQSSCMGEVGQVQTQRLSKEQLKERHEARVKQFECLVENGMLEGEPKSFEVFVEDWERSGQKEFWSPARDVPLEVAAQGRLGPSQLCPFDGTVW